MKVSEAKHAAEEIAKATEHLARLVQQAALHGMTCEFNTLPFQHVSGLTFEIVTVECRIKPSMLECG